MSYKEFDITGGESVYCINESQRNIARELFTRGDSTSLKLSAYLERIQQDLTRNEQAAIAFELIDGLLKTS